MSDPALVWLASVRLCCNSWFFLFMVVATLRSSVNNLAVVSFAPHAFFPSPAITWASPCTAKVRWEKIIAPNLLSCAFGGGAQQKNHRANFCGVCSVPILGSRVLVGTLPPVSGQCLTLPLHSPSLLSSHETILLCVGGHTPKVGQS